MHMHMHMHICAWRPLFVAALAAAREPEARAATAKLHTGGVSVPRCDDAHTCLIIIITTIITITFDKAYYYYHEYY